MVVPGTGGPWPAPCFRGTMALSPPSGGLPMRRIDLTGPIYEGMWTYGFPVPEVRVRRVASLERDGFDAHSLHLGNVQGTCIETAAHLLPGQPTIDQVALDRFFVRAAVVQLPDKGPRELITAEELQRTGVSIEPGMAVILATGWDRMWDHHRFYWDSPQLAPDAMRWLMARRPSILGVDLTSTDSTEAPAGINKLMFGTGCMLLAPLINLRQIRQPYVDLIVLPIPVRGACGAPCRAVAVEA